MPDEPADLDAIFAEVVEGLVDNSRVNRVPYSEGWTAHAAIELYYLDDDAVQEKHGTLTRAQTDELEARVSRWLDERQGQSWHQDR